MSKTLSGSGLADLLRRDGIGLQSEAPSALGILGGGLTDLLRAPRPAPLLKPNSAHVDPVEKYILWERAAKADGFDPAVWRRDRFGGWMRFDEYGESTDFGWVKDQLIPAALGGADSIENHAATHWLNIRRKGARLLE